MSTTLVVMAFNEEGALAATVEELLGVLRRQGEPFDVLVIDDGSTDGTPAIADELVRAHPEVRALHHGANQGLGGVYRTGFREAGGDWLTFIPADGQLPPDAVVEFMRAREGYDLVLGYHLERLDGLWARFLSWAERLLYRLLFGYVPKFQGIFMIRTSLLRQIQLRSTGRGWSIVMELVLRVVRKGHRWVNVATGCRVRRFGRSKVRNLPTILANLRELLRLRFLLWS
ncbi:MAG: glycosyltransferase family 2 protein [Candidatus Eremiobacterota bacterium]